MGREAENGSEFAGPPFVYGMLLSRRVSSFKTCSELA